LKYHYLNRYYIDFFPSVSVFDLKPRVGGYRLAYALAMTWLMWQRLFAQFA